MSETKYFTTRELFKTKLLLTKKQTPIKSLSHIHAIVNRLATVAVPSSWGPVKVLSENQIKEYNEQQKLYGEIEQQVAHHNLSTVLAPPPL